MNEKTVLSQQQIELLFAFCRKHYVRYYDVQIELVDHLANAIEEKMSTDNKISFEKALDEVYATFGYKGFAGIVEAKTNTLSKQYSKLRWKYFGEYFTIPKIVFTMMICVGLYVIGKVADVENLRMIVSAIALLFVGSEFIYARKFSKKIKQFRKELLILGSGIATQSFIGFLGLQILIQSISFSKNNQFSLTQYCFLSIVIVILILITIAQRKVNEQVIAKAKQDYPLAFE